MTVAVGDPGAAAMAVLSELPPAERISVALAVLVMTSVEFDATAQHIHEAVDVALNGYGKILAEEAGGVL